MKTNTVIADSNGNRKVTSTTEQLRIPASEIRPGDWLLKPHRRGLAKDKLVKATARGEGAVRGSYPVRVFFELGGSVSYLGSYLVDVERTT